MHGVFRYLPALGSWQHITGETGAFRLNNNIIYGLVQDNKGNIWIGTDHGGINVLNKRTVPAIISCPMRTIPVALVKIVSSPPIKTKQVLYGWVPLKGHQFLPGTCSRVSPVFPPAFGSQQFTL
nr:two-component regulator propeller domain-containing protein [Paraflavitalea speifideiaquila]